jgi:hypothetical protein
LGIILDVRCRVPSVRKGNGGRQLGRGINSTELTARGHERFTSEQSMKIAVKVDLKIDVASCIKALVGLMYVAHIVGLL